MMLPLAVDHRAWPERSLYQMFSSSGGLEHKYSKPALDSSDGLIKASQAVPWTCLLSHERVVHMGICV